MATSFLRAELNLAELNLLGIGLTNTGFTNLNDDLIAVIFDFKSFAFLICLTKRI
jgi:hypothetical protein